MKTVKARTAPPVPTFETDAWPFLQAKHYTKVTGKRPVRLLVIHDMEFGETLTAAEIIAKDFATAGPTDVRSAHVCIDADSTVQCVHDNDIAYAAPGANNDGIQIELAGYQRQTRSEWLDAYGFQLLHRAADVAAQYCLKYMLPPIHLTDAALKAGAAGIIGHDQATRVYKKSTHADPGFGFPWTEFLTMVQAARTLRLRLCNG